MYFLIEDDDLLDKYNTIWDNVSTDIKKEFDSELVCKKRFLKTKIKSHCDEFRDFYSKEIFILDSNHTCLAVTSLDSGLKKGGNYYLKVFLKDCKYINSKALFFLKILKFLSWLFGHVAERPDKKDKVNFKFYDVTTWLTNNRNTHIAQYFEK